MPREDCKICQSGVFCQYHGAPKLKPIVGDVKTPLDLPFKDEGDGMVPNILGSNVGPMSNEQLDSLLKLPKDDPLCFVKLYGGQGRTLVEMDYRPLDMDVFNKRFKEICNRMDEAMITKIVANQSLPIVNVDNDNKPVMVDGHIRLQVHEELVKEETLFDQLTKSTFTFDSIRSKGDPLIAAKDGTKEDWAEAFEKVLQDAKSYDFLDMKTGGNPCAEIAIGESQPGNLKGPALERLKARCYSLYCALPNHDERMKTYMAVKIMEVFDIFDRLNEAKSNA